MNTHVDIVESIIRLGIALALGSAIGFERQWNQKMAGLRTNALVALGACGFVVFSAMVGEGDPTRIAAQVVTGIGFLGAGVILREGINVHGINTAATLWCSAMVGTFAGGGFLGVESGGREFRRCDQSLPAAVGAKHQSPRGSLK
jgi:putative Mg2+ transporter-C (MgtC) family protein